MEDDNLNTGEEFEAAAQVTEESMESQADQEQYEDQTVPLSALKSEREQRQKLQEELQLIKDNLALMQSQRPQETPKKDEFDGLTDDDVLTVKDFKNLLNKEKQTFQMSIEEMRMAQKYPDYQEVITKYLPEVLKTNPSLKGSLQKTQDYELAYHLAKTSDAYKSETKKTKKNQDAQRIVENSSRAGSLSSVGGTSPISQAKRYKEMSDSDFMKMANKNLGYF